MQWLPRVLSGTVAAGVLALRAARAGRPKRRPKAAAERQRYASLPRVERAGGRAAERGKTTRGERRRSSRCGSEWRRVGRRRSRCGSEGRAAPWRRSRCGSEGRRCSPCGSGALRRGAGLDARVNRGVGRRRVGRRSSRCGSEGRAAPWRRSRCGSEWLREAAARPDAAVSGGAPGGGAATDAGMNGECALGGGAARCGSERRAGRRSAARCGSECARGLRAAESDRERFRAGTGRSPLQE
jgi:hypothetical protein